MLISCFLFVHWIDGLIFLGALQVMCYVAAQIWLYYTNNFYMKPIWALVNRTLIVLCVLFAFIWSAFDSELTSYEGGSYSASVLLFFIWAYAVSSYFIDFYQGDEQPVYFSTSLFPVYQFNPKLNDVRPHGASTGAFLVAFALMFFWAFVSNTQFRP